MRGSDPAVPGCDRPGTGCITSPGFPRNYSADSYCAIAVNSSAAVPIHVEAFATEPGFAPDLIVH